MRVPRTRSARLRKIGGDLGSNKPRTALVTVSIVVGVAGLGMVVGARTLMLDSLSASAKEAAFASATFRTDPFGSALLERVRTVPGVAGAEARRIVAPRIRTKGRFWNELTLAALPDYDRTAMNRISREAGAWPPPPRALLIERSSLGELKAKIGERVVLQMPDGTRRALPVAGTVHDLSSPSTRTSGMSYGYVSFSTLRWLGDRGGFNELDVLADRKLNRRQVEQIAAHVRLVVERSGRMVFATTVPKPGRFWAYDAVQSMVLLLSVLAVVCLLMSGLLVVNTVSSLLTQQLWQIGVMKSVGASAQDTGSMYLGTAVLYGLVALVVAVPVGALGALLIVASATKLINLNTPAFTLVPGVLALEIGAGLALPALAAIAPVVKASRTTVRDAISRHGLGFGATGGGLGDRFLERLALLPAAARLALRNTLRRRLRLVLTLGALVIGGTIFISLLSVRASLASTLDAEGKYRNYDVELTLDQAYPARALEREAVRAPGVLRAVAWTTGAAYRVRSDGSQSETLVLTGLPAGTQLVQPIVVAGRWLRPGDRHGVVVNTDVRKSEPDVVVGRPVTLTVNGRDVTWPVVGVVRSILAGSVIYADARTVAAATGELGRSRKLVVVTARHDRAGERLAAQALADRLKRAGFVVGAVQTTADRRHVDAANFGVISSFLMTMAVLIAAVGGLGLMGTLGLGVLERSREIGVLRAVGAGSGDVMQLVVVEGLVIGLLGWLVAAPLALPVSRMLSDKVGEFFIGTPLTYSFPASVVFIWLGIVVVLAVVASSLPAWKAARLTVRDALVYE
jgi:putative ABC transport system permease protein